MPVGYLIPVALVAVGTLFALRPVPFERPLGRLSYYFGLAANELPFAALFWLLLFPTRWRSPKATSTRRAAGRSSPWPP
ncbi:hypothetical protein [Actinomadura sp. CNU-125]|uniref:hypothetical protein n=1 Tax=Actinomadura sp. CNU-125 TaxID=1904961 RepID=UPI0021CCA068|nr:hypothetical protein [Actinomadura sp. CNU-125]